MEKKNNGIVIVFIVVIVLLLSYIIGHISFFKVTNKNETVSSDKERVDSDSKNTSTKEETLDVNSSLVQGLYNKVVLTGDSFYKYWFYNNSNNYQVSNASESSKLALVYHNLKKSDFTPIQNATGIQKNITLNNNNYTLQEGSSTGFIPYERVEQTYKELFGSSDTLNKSEPMRVGPYVTEYYVYDESVNGYVDYLTVGGGATGSFYHGEVTKAVRSGDTIVITEKADFSENDDGAGKITSTENYEYTFKLSGDTYSFVSRIKL